MKRMLVLLAAAAISAFACGQVGAPPRTTGVSSPAPAREAGTDRLYLTSAADRAAVQVVDPAAGTVERTLPGGEPAPDWSRLYSVSHAASGASLQLLDGATGHLLGTLPVPGWVSGARLSGNGRWLALIPAQASQSGPTRFQVRDAGLQRKPTDVELKGSFTYDGLSDDGRRLYLLEWAGGTSYRVRLYDLARSQLLPQAIADKSEPPGSLMSGTAVRSLASKDGQMQLTLYEGNAKGMAFVHALPIAAELPFAYCVDLPGPGTGWTLAPAPDGHRFYAVNLASGSILELTTNRTNAPRVRWGSLPAGSSGSPLVQDVQAKEVAERPPAAVSTDGSALFVARQSQILGIDTRDLKPRRAIQVNDDSVSSLGFGPSGWLYALGVSGRLLRIDPASMQVASQSAPLFAGLEIMRVAPARP